VQGGGIYAASAATAFLAGLQDANPSFARHIFAISSVSGGAIAATVFQVLAGEGRTQPSRECDVLQHKSGPIEREMAKVMLDDHFSPVVASIVPDFLGFKWDRAEALEKSFVNSVKSCSRVAAKKLDDPFSAHWSTRDPTPSLALNTTWAETGYRVVFAPFVLDGDGTIFSFADNKLVGGAKEQPTLMHAAIASARFPGILPPYSIRKEWMDGKGQRHQQRWNFVDGGYSDNSGSTTAFDIYNALKDAADHANVDLQLIDLTGAKVNPGFATIDGTSFRDIIAPIDAILSVRRLLADQAVTRVVKSFEERKDLTETNKLKVVELQDKLFALPLGWNISKTTFGVVSLLMGRSELCPKPAENECLPGRDTQGISDVLRCNSCKMNEISNVLPPVESRSTDPH
jgi:hypothetical protein